MALLSKAQITSADDRKWEDVCVPEWGGTVRLLALSGTDREAWELSTMVMGPNGSVQRRNLVDARAKLLAKCLIDEDGHRLFTDKEVKDLSAKSGAVIDRLFDIARRMSGLGKDAVEAKAGNFEAGPSAGSTSA